MAVCWLLLAGGALGAGEGAAASPKAAFEAFRQAAKAGQRAAVLACFEAATRKKLDALEKAGEPSALQELVETAVHAKIEVGEEKTEGDKAALEVSADGDKDTIHFVKEGHAWKIRIPDADLEEIAGEIRKSGEPARTPDFSSPRAAWLTMWAAARAGDRQGVAPCFTKDTAAKLREVEEFLAPRAKDLPEGMSSVIDQIAKKAKSAKMEITEEKTEGGKATLRVRIGENAEDIRLVREGETWKIDLELPDAATMKAKIEGTLKARKAAEGGKK